MSRYFIPGPVEVAPQVLAAQARPILPPGSPEFQTLLTSVENRLQRVFSTREPVFLLAGNENSLRELAARSLVEKSVLLCVNGLDSRLWADIFSSIGKDVVTLSAEWGEVIDPLVLEETLKQMAVEAVVIVHADLATGVINPLKELAETVHRNSPEALILVDGCGTLGGSELDTDAWGLDFVFTGTQYCLAAPPGLGIFAISARAREKAASIQNKGWITDFSRLEQQRRLEPGSLGLPVSLVYALDLQLDRILLEGLSVRCERHRHLTQIVLNWAEKTGIKSFIPPNLQSPSVIVLNNQFSWDITDLNQFLLQAGMRIANGAGMLKDRTFRISVMGEATEPDLQRLLDAINRYKQKQIGG